MTAPASLRRSVGLFFFLPACFIVEIILGGPLGIYAGLPVRYILFSVCCAVLSLALLVRGRVARAHVLSIASIAGFLLLNAMWMVLVPALTGGKFAYALGEARAFAALVLVVLVLMLVGRHALHELVRRLQVIVVWTSAVLALGQVLIWAIGTLVPEAKVPIQLALVQVYSGAENSLYVGPMPDGFFRVFWICSLWELLALFWLSVIRSAILRVPLRIVLILGLLVTYSRGIWLGAILGLLVTQLAELTVPRLTRVVVRTALVASVVAGMVIGALAWTGELERGMARFTSTASTEDDGVNIRLEQAHYLSQVWAEHELLGGGYGAYHPRYQRSQDAPFSYEHMPYAFLAKLGFIGVFANLLFLLHWALTAWRMRLRTPAAGSFLGAATAFLIAAMTNPMLLNLVGITILGCLLLQWASVQVIPAELALGSDASRDGE